MKNKFFSVILSILVSIVGFAGGFAYRVFIEDAPKSDVYVSGDLSIHFLQLGNIYTGDSVYIKCGENDILVDAGSANDSSATIIEYVDQFVEDNTLEYVIATHGHTDHIAAFYSEAGRESVFDHYKVETIIDFPLTNSSGGERTVVGKYRKARDAEVEKGAKHYTALDCYNNANGASRVYKLSDSVELEILYNFYYENEDKYDENNYSVCFMINQGDNHYMFTGDLEKEGEEELVKYYEANHGGLPQCVLYKAGHHGSKTSSCSDFMAAIQPKYVCVCCCAGTSEYTDEAENQFPTQRMIDNVAPYTDKVYVTSVVDNYVDHDNWDKYGTVKPLNGNIVFTVSAGKISIECSHSNLILKETDWFKENRTMPSEWAA